jgi:uncharacterized protein YjiS (DUF1127 family)
MALIQTDHDDVVRLADSLRAAAPVWPLSRQVADLCESILALIRWHLGRLAQWAARRRARNGLTRAERARQRRELAQLTDRELHDIGITRYDIEFVLRQPHWR